MAKPIVLCDTAGMTNDRWLECRMHGPKRGYSLYRGRKRCCSYFWCITVDDSAGAVENQKRGK